MSEDNAPPLRAPVLYVTDLSYDRLDPADLFDLAYLLRSPDHDLRGVCLTEESGGDRVLDALSLRVAADADVSTVRGAAGLAGALAASDEPLSLIVVGGYGMVAEALARDRDLFRARVARLFLVGGYVNDYNEGRAGERLAINPRLLEQHPERFRGRVEPRSAREAAPFGRLLTSGEGVIWLPRDICLWRYAAPGILENGGPMAEFLLRELFYWNLHASGPDADRYDAAEAPVLLSAPPAFLLAARPDPAAFMRHFRALTARAEVDENGVVTAFATRTDSPNLYAVVGIDGQALGKIITPRLRDRPLA